MQQSVPLNHLAIASELLNYLVQENMQPGERVPSLGELSEKLHISVSKLREQLEVARSLGLVTVRPRTGIHLQEYSFMPTVRLGLFFALANDIVAFNDYSDLRRRLEKAYWRDAVSSLNSEEKKYLLTLVNQAWEKLRGNPVRIPHSEHREFHLAIFSRLDNVFVQGLLEAYWEAYEGVELHAYTDYQYLQQVWEYHERIANAIIEGDIEGSLQAYDEHTQLLKNFPERETL